MTNQRDYNVAAADGARIAVHEIGAQDGRPLVLIHGLMSSAQVNWIKYGTAQRLADAGYRCIMPDLRGHGDSAAPEDAASYPADILVRDNAGIIATLGLSDYDLCGFSLGARTSVKLVLDGAAPRRLILSGMGLDGLVDWGRRRDYFTGVIDNADTLKRGDPGYMAAQFMRTTGINRAAARHVVESFGDLDPARLAAIAMPTLVLTGTEDRDNGAPDTLAAALPQGSVGEIPGNHMSCVTKPDFGRAILAYLGSAQEAAIMG
ncbi:alpha/beta hydrolase [Sphingobium sufflavum]|uniref:alpha/beta fold hydrolase n=1 Tax=Sphingobium sufflavum TaxID=1129547 RepID=UPI001F1A954E|nr:alpha/beta hydrolase [Sphingobium sufflavum]MCE7797055.1 alpha/beta hydrolase [Sphingobium sufflavum]